MLLQKKKKKWKKIQDFQHIGILGEKKHLHIHKKTINKLTKVRTDYTVKHLEKLIFNEAFFHLNIF